MQPHSRLDFIASDFIRLALKLDIHNRGYIDGYFASPKYKKHISTNSKGYPLPNIIREAGELRARLCAIQGGDTKRRHYLAASLRGLEMRARTVSGEKVPLIDEMRACYDIDPVWTPESQFEELHRELNALLPSGTGSLADRYQEHVVNQRSIPAEQAKQLLETFILPELRKRTAAMFPLPEMAAITLELAHGVPWTAYNFYKGAFLAGVAFNADKQMELPSLAATAAHEAWPGHATDHSIHEALLGIGQGQVEHQIILYGSPRNVVSETWAVLALSVLMSPKEIIEFQQRLFKQADKSSLDAVREQRITEVYGELRAIQGNMCIMLDRGESESAAIEYAQKWHVGSAGETDRMIKFINKFGRAYPFTYYVGRPRMEALFKRPEGMLYWAGRILTEPVTPSLMRAWVDQGPLAVPPEV